MLSFISELMSIFVMQIALIQSQVKRKGQAAPSAEEGMSSHWRKGMVEQEDLKAHI